MLSTRLPPFDPVPDPDPEKTAGLTFASGTHTPQQGQKHVNHHYGARAKERIRQFLHPSGKKIHVAASPEEALHLRQKLSRLHKEDEFDVYVSGSPEHLEAVRQAQTHHEARREELRQQHQDIYERFADVHAELDMLSSELDRVTTHGVSLEAHFDKFGYAAHIKSYDDEESPSHSGTSTPRSSIDGKRSHSTTEKRSATRLKLFQTPVVRQYFHKGILWRGSDFEEVQSFELFVDLLYVGIIAINGDAASEDPTGWALLQFVITFTLGWKIWNDMALIISWFETDDMFQRFSILFLLACLFGYTTNITQSFDTTYPTLVGFYLASRLYMVCYLLAISFIIPMIRGVMLWHVGISLMSAALWVGSIHLPWPNKPALIFVAMFMDICGQVGYIALMVLCYKIGGNAKDWFHKAFEFWPAINIEHRTERMNAFVTLVFGYTVVALLYQSTVNGIDAFFGKAILGLVQAFCFNWIYFEVDGANLHMHAIRRHKLSAFSWSTAHLPFIMGFVLGGGALSRLVLVTDSLNSPLDNLTETYQAKSVPYIRSGIRWFYCGGFGVALACMGLISLSHVHREIEGLRLKKWKRLTIRFCIAAVIVCLPLADGLNSVELIGIVTALVAYCLFSELWAGSSRHDHLFQRSKPCKYFGQCGKKELEALVKHGKEVDVDVLVEGKKKNDGLTVAL